MSRKRKSFRHRLGQLWQQLHPGSAGRGRRCRSSSSPHGFTPRFEQLEQRQLLSASPVWVSPTWLVTAPANHVGLAPVAGDTVSSGDGSAAGKTFGTNAFATIQSGVNGVQAGGTVDVTAGTYAESVTVNKSVTLLGVEQSVDPRATGTAARPAGESIVEPPSDLSSNGNVFTVTANNVTIAGFDIRGSNPSLSSGGVTVNGVKVYAARGVANGSDGGTWTPISNLTVQDNIVQDFARVGVELDNNGITVTASNLVTTNAIDNLQGYNSTTSSSLGSKARMGVFIGTNAYADVTNNAITRAERGITLQSYTVAAPGVSGPAIEGNVISSSTSGIYYATGISANAPTISGNTLSSLGATNTAILLLNDPSTTTLSNNTINAGAIFGYAVWPDNQDTSPLTISGGSVTGATQVGILFTNDDAPLLGNSESSSGWTSVAGQELNVSGVTISASAIGVVVTDSTANTNPAKSVALTLTGSTISGGGTGVYVSGPQASAAISGDTISGNATGILFTGGGSGIATGNNFAGTTANATDLVINSAASSVTIGDGNAFDGSTAYLQNLGSQSYDLSGYTSTTFAGFNAATTPVAAGNLSTFYGIEDKITDGLDNASYGYVRIKSGYDFVAYSSETATAGAIQRGVNAANTDEAVVPTAGDVIEVQAGTYPETVNITDKGVSLAGPNAGVSGTGTRLPEAIVSGSSSNGNEWFGAFNVTFTLAVVDQTVAIDGFEIQPTGVNGGVSISGYASPNTNSASVSDNIIDVGGSTSISAAVAASNLDNLSIADNQIRNANTTWQSGIKAGWIGNAQITGNTIAGANWAGIVVDNCGAATIDANTVTNIGQSNGIQISSDTGGATISNNVVSGIAGTAAPAGGIDIYNNYSGTGPIAITGNQVSGAPDGLLVESGAVLTGQTVTASGNTFTGDANAIYAGTGQIDASGGNTFNGVNSSGATLGQLYAVQDQIVDAIDQTGLGVVRIKAGNLYVTPNSYVLDTSASGAVARATAVAVAGDTINVQSSLSMSVAPSTSIVYGTPTTGLSGTLSADSWVPPPPGSVSITVNGIPGSAAITAATGAFADDFPTASLKVGHSPYTITYGYSGGSVGGVNYNYSTDGTSDSVSNTATTLTVTPAPLTVTATGVGKTYDGTTSATVLLADNRLAGDNLTESYTSASFSSANLGTNIPVSVSGIAISGPDAGNYILQNSTASTTADIYPASAVIDDGDPAWTTTGAWTNYTGQGYQNDVDQATPITSSNGPATCAWTFSGLNPNQNYLVEASWTTNSNRATNAPYTISGGPSTLTLPVTVNQQRPPAGVSALGWTWQELGVYQPTTGTLVVTLSNSGVNGNVIADAVRLEAAPANGPAIMVQAGTGSETDPVVLPTLSGNVQTSVNFGTTPAGNVSQKTFTLFNGGGAALSLSKLSVPAGYSVVSGGFGATPVTVLPGGSTQLVLQQNTSAVGSFGGTVTFATNDSRANAFSFPVTGTVGDVAPTAVISNTGPVNLGSSVTVALGNASDPSSVDTAAGFRYSFAFSEAALSKSYATTGVISSATYTFTAPGTFTVWGRILDVNGLYTDYSTLITVKSTSIIIDDGDPAWTTSGTWTTYTGQGYENDVDQATPITSSNGLATSTWTFTGLNPGQYYKVETTWTKNTNRATNAPYTISGGAVTLPIAVNQQPSPVGVSGDNWTWQELGLYEPTSGTLVVTLSNSGANGNVIADAVRIEPAPASGPAIMVQAGTGSAVDPVVLPTLSGSVQTTVSFGTVAAGTVSQKTFTVFNGGGTALSLSNLSVPAGFTLVSGFGVTTLPSGRSTTFVLQENTSTATALAGMVSFTTSDGSVNPLSFPVAGTVTDVPPTATIGNNGPVGEGSPVTVSLTNPYDPVSADTAKGFHYSFAFSEAALSKSYATTGSIASASYTFGAAGTYTIWGRILDVNGAYTDYSTQVTVEALPLFVMNDSAPGFQMTGTWSYWPNQGYAGDDHEAAAPNSKATWTFSDLTAGTYLVYATWPAQRNRADNTPYSVTVGSGTANVLVNQKISPSMSIAGSGPTGGAWSWYQLGATSFTVAANGTLVVGISNTGADGYVEADAVMLVLTQPQLAPAHLAAPAGAQGSTAAAQVVATDAVFAALAQPQGSTTSSKTTATNADALWLLYGQE